MTTATADPLRKIVEDRVEELLRFRHWYRVHRAINLDTIEAIHTAELRALVRLLRAARLQEKADTVWRLGARRDRAHTSPCDFNSGPGSDQCGLCGAYPPGYPVPLAAGTPAFLVCGDFQVELPPDVPAAKAAAYVAYHDLQAR